MRHSDHNFDRFIPSRQTSNLETPFDDSNEFSSRSSSVTASSSGANAQNSVLPGSVGGGSAAFNNMLRAELLSESSNSTAFGEAISGGTDIGSSARLRLRSSPSRSPGCRLSSGSPGGSTVLSFKSRRRHDDDDVHHVSSWRGGAEDLTPNENRYMFTDGASSSSNSAPGAVSPLSAAPHLLPTRNALLQYSRNQTADYERLVYGERDGVGGLDLASLPAGSSATHRPPQQRKIARAPFKILDAPNLQDDYYLNLLDWSSQNILAVGLGGSVYLWSGYTSKVAKLCDLGGGSTVTSICWTGAGDYLAVGTSDGSIQLWDPKHGCAAATTGAAAGSSGVKVRDLAPHSGRVGTLGWHNSLLASGSRDRSVYVQDVRVRGGGASSSGQSRRGSPGPSPPAGSPGSLTPGGSRPRAVSRNDVLLNPSISTSLYNESPRTRPGAELRFPVFAPEDEGGRGGAESSLIGMIAQVTQSRPPPTPGTAVMPNGQSSAHSTVPSTPLVQGAAIGRMSGVHSDPSQVWDRRRPLISPGSSPLRSQLATLSYNRRRHQLRHGGLLLPDPPGVSTPPSVVFELQSHKQEVCGLKWSPNGRQIATGGNDNKLFIWDIAGSSRSRMNSSGGHSINSSRSDNSMDDTVIDNSFSSSSSSSSRPDSTSTLAPLFQFNDHVAAVKAVAWSPHQNGLLASGGGTADRTIRYWNTLTGACVHAVDTGSQVCNLVWSASVNEVVSTHGYSLNQIIVWKYPSMHKVATLTGHSTRVVYLAMSPDGQSIVTGAGDETLRFWHLFPSGKSSSLGEGTTSNSKYTSSVHNHLYERNSLTDGYARCGNVSDVLVPTGNSIR